MFVLAWQTQPTHLPAAAALHHWRRATCLQLVRVPASVDLDQAQHFWNRNGNTEAERGEQNAKRQRTIWSLFNFRSGGDALMGTGTMSGSYGSVDQSCGPVSKPRPRPSAVSENLFRMRLGVLIHTDCAAQHGELLMMTSDGSHRRCLASKRRLRPVAIRMCNKSYEIVTQCFASETL